MASEVRQRVVYLLKRTDKPYDTTDIYVGSTSLTLKQRLRVHRRDALSPGYINNRLYIKMLEELDNWEVLPLLMLTCDKKTIRGFEREWCKALSADLNMRSAINESDKKREYDSKYYRLRKNSNVHHYDVCNKSFRRNLHLQNHLHSIKHGYAYLHSLD